MTQPNVCHAINRIIRSVACSIPTSSAPFWPSWTRAGHRGHGQLHTRGRAGEAAERVNKTQSAVSMHIRRLEERLGRPLFVKAGRGVRLTDDGEKLIEFARQMLQIEA